MATTEDYCLQCSCHSSRQSQSTLSKGFPHTRKKHNSELLSSGQVTVEYIHQRLPTTSKKHHSELLSSGQVTVRVHSAEAPTQQQERGTNPVCLPLSRTALGHWDQGPGPGLEGTIHLPTLSYTARVRGKHSLPYSA